jgi:hypothetical protein
MSAPWLRILEHKEHFGFEIGPTIPFLLGAIRQAQDPSGSEVSRQQLHDLLVEMRDSLSAPACIAIGWCGGYLADYVVELRDSKPAGECIESPVHPGNGLYHVAIPGVHDLDSLRDVLWDRYKEHLSKEEFSRDGETWTWRRFTTQELVCIKEALAS